jgi:hypothetical protein
MLINDTTNLSSDELSDSETEKVVGGMKNNVRETGPEDPDEPAIQL